jgi:hypothetical protein
MALDLQIPRLVASRCFRPILNLVRDIRGI